MVDLLHAFKVFYEPLTITALEGSQDLKITNNVINSLYKVISRNIQSHFTFIDINLVKTSHPH